LRSVTNRFLLLRTVAALAVAYALPGAASAATTTVPVPPDAPTVATTPSGGTVIAWMNGAKLCSVFQGAGTARPASLVLGTSTGADQGSCVPPPVLSQFGATSLAPIRFRLAGVGSYALWGVVAPAVARVEARTGGVVTAASAATVAPLPGAAAELRFWALDVPDTPTPDEFALLDDAGVVRRALRADDWIGFTFRDQPPSGDTILQRGGRGHTTWRLHRFAERTLAPTPLEPERREEQRCVSFITGSSTDPVDVGATCEHELLDQTPVTAYVESDCALGAYVTAMVRVPVRTVVAVLGDGTRRTVPLKALGGFYPGGRAGVLIVGHGMAIRRLLALDRSGRTILTNPSESAPAAESPCNQDSGSYTGFEPGPRETPLRAGSHVPHVADRDARICLAIDRAPRPPEDCALPPIDPREALVRTSPVAGGAQHLYVLVPAEVAQARVTLDDRTTRTIAAAPVTGYAGRYALFLREAALSVPAGRNVTGLHLLDARGRTFDARFPAFTTDLPRLGRAFTLAPAVQGVGPLRAAAFRGFGEQLTCLSFRSLAGLDHCDFAMEAKAEPGDSSLQLRALCAPRRLVLLAALPHRDDRVSIRLRSGRTIRARSIRLPGRAGAAAGRSIAFAVLGPRERPDEIRLRGRSSRRLLVTLPTASAQCGYTAELSFENGVAE
jgi:hypothetical protein